MAANDICVQTFAFFDLETTGLSTNEDRITEIAVVAVTRDEFLRCSRIEDAVLPRVVQKISLIVDPGVPVPYWPARVSGLNSENISGYQNFTFAFNCLQNFLSGLPAPICFIAHNGNRFDFPLFKSELRRHGLKFTNSENYFSFDSVPSLKKIDLQWIGESISCRQNLQNIPENNVNGVQFQQIIENTATEFSENVIISNSQLNENDEEALIATVRECTVQIAPIIAYTVTYKDRKEVWQSPPKKKQDLALCQVVEEDESPKPRAYQIVASLDRVPRSYTLSNVYQRLFQKEPVNAHAAEGDCVALLEICFSYGQAFVNSLDQSAAKLF